jgi:hypothetical protein
MQSWFYLLHMCVCSILASSRITRSGSWRWTPHFWGGSVTWRYANSMAMAISISSSKSWCWSLPTLASSYGSWLFGGACWEDMGTVWGNCYLIRPSGPLVSMSVVWDSVEVYGWLVWGMWLVKTVVSVMLCSKALLAWDGPSTRNSLVDLFLRGISWVFYPAREHSGRQILNLLDEGYKSRTKKCKIVSAARETIQRWHVL